MPKVSTSKRQRSSSDYTPSSRKGDSGGSVAKDQKVHDSPVAWPLRGQPTKYNKSTKMPEVKCTVVGSGGLR